MRLTLDELADYSAKLGSLSDFAEADVTEKLVRSWLDVRDDSSMALKDKVARLRDDAAHVLVDAENSFGIGSASIGSQMYSRFAGDGKAVTGLDYPDIAQEDSDMRSARYWAKFIDGTDEGFEKFLGGVCAKARRQVSHAADREVAASAMKRGRKGGRVRFARVPSGPSCGFCIMLASRGFVYATRESAGEFTKFHDDCDCRVVAGMQGMEVEGYDPKELYKRYKLCRDTLGSVDDVWRDWEALPDEEKDKYGDKPRLPVFDDPERQRELEKTAGRNADAFNDYYARRITAEMDTRDREWLWSGKPCYRTKEPGARPLKKERDVGTALLGHGFNVEFLKEINQTGVKTADARLNEDIWEFKIPEGWNGEHTIRKQFYKAQDKGTSKLLISATKNGAPIDEMAYWVGVTFMKGDYAQITEVLLMSSDGDSLIRLHRKQ